MSWTEVFIGDTYTDYIQTTQFSTGAAFDAAAVPVVKVYEEATDTAILASPTDFTVAKLDDAGTVGLYRFQLDVSALNGFEAGKRYCVRMEATVDSVAMAAVVARLVVRTPYWTEAPTEVTGRATTNVDALGQIYARLFNKQTKDHDSGEVKVFKADSSTEMVSGTDTETDTTSTAGKLS